MRDFGDERLKRMLEHRPVAPKRAVITGGMPYGNKDLHYGHVLGMFLYADFMARFLRDRIGKDNVIFVSGTDCYGSPAMETIRKKQDEGYTGTLEDMYEPYLIQAGFIKRTPRGRMVTDLAYKHLGLPIPQTNGE